MTVQPYRLGHNVVYFLPYGIFRHAWEGQQAFPFETLETVQHQLEARCIKGRKVRH